MPASRSFPGEGARPERPAPARPGASEAGIEVAPEDPGVLAPAALRRVDDQRARLERDAGQAAGDDADLVAVEDVWAQVDVAAGEALVAERRVAGEPQRRL